MTNTQSSDDLVLSGNISMVLNERYGRISSSTCDKAGNGGCSQHAIQGFAATVSSSKISGQYEEGYFQFQVRKGQCAGPQMLTLRR